MATSSAHTLGRVGDVPSWTIAVVIPAYNRAETIGRALESVRSQRRPPDEIIVVDDGSTDVTADRARHGDGVRIVGLPRSGVSAARNAGVEASSADFVAFLDSDDRWDAGHLSRTAAAIRETGGGASLYFSDMDLRRTPAIGSLWALCGFAIDGPYALRERDKDWLFMSRQPMMIPASVVRRDSYLSVGGSEPRLTRRSDTHLIFKLGLSGAMCAVAGFAGVANEPGPNSLSRVYPPGHDVYLRCTTRLYADLLHFDGLTEPQRRILRERLTDAQLSIARRSGWRAPRVTAAHLRDALRNDPAGVARLVRRRRSVRGTRPAYPETGVSA